MTTIVETGKLGIVCPPLVSEDRTDCQGMAQGSGPGQRAFRPWFSSRIPPFRGSLALGKYVKPPGHLPSWPWGGFVGPLDIGI